jgi:two-component system, chemotaxis family, protein-glutamate methylesterase/glutaminase
MKNSPKIHVLVADDSVLMRLMISDILNAAPGIMVLDTASNGKDAVEKTISLRPDVVVMDMNMGEYDGRYAVKRIMKECPTPIVILSAVGNSDMSPIFEVLAEGAIDYLNKPVSNSTHIDQLGDELIAKVEVAAVADIGVLKKSAPRSNQHVHSFSGDVGYDAIIIGASTGGPTAIEKVITRLPANLVVPVIVAQHMPANFVPSFASRLDTLTPLSVTVGRKDEVVEKGRIVIAPGGRNMVLRRNVVGDVVIDFTTKRFKEYNFPSINALMLSGAEVYGRRCIGVVLTGMGKDGSEGMHAIFQAGGYTIAQNKESCVVFGMPREVIETGNARQVVPLDEIGGFLVGCLS